MRDSFAPWLLLPVKSISQGKQRLKPILGDRERMQFNEFLLVRMLSMASRYPGLDRTVVVSDAEDTIAIARSCCARTVRSGGVGLNRALNDGRRAVLCEHDKSLLVLPVDLPFVDSEDIEQISRLSQNYMITICPDRSWSGTNALFFAKGAAIPFHFGGRSFQKHQAEASRSYGKSVCIHFNAQIAHDIDTPPDLLLLNRFPPSAEKTLSWHAERVGL